MKKPQTASKLCLLLGLENEYGKWVCSYEIFRDGTTSVESDSAYINDVDMAIEWLGDHISEAKRWASNVGIPLEIWEAEGFTGNLQKIVASAQYTIGIAEAAVGLIRGIQEQGEGEETR